jgi:hypothetical protein
MVRRKQDDYNTVDMSRIRMYNDYFPPTKQLSTLALVGYGIFQ